MRRKKSLIHTFCACIKISRNPPTPSGDWYIVVSWGWESVWNAHLCYLAFHIFTFYGDRLTTAHGMHTASSMIYSVRTVITVVVWATRVRISIHWWCSSGVPISCSQPLTFGRERVKQSAIHRVVPVLCMNWVQSDHCDAQMNELHIMQKILEVHRNRNMMSHTKRSIIALLLDNSMYMYGTSPDLLPPRSRYIAYEASYTRQYSQDYRIYGEINSSKTIPARILTKVIQGQSVGEKN